MWRLGSGPLDTGEEKNKLEQLYNHYRRLMFTCAREILKDDRLAEEAVQEAFIKLAGYLKKIHEIESNKTLRFVVIVVECAAKDIYRKEKRFRCVPWETIETYYQFPPRENLGELTEVERAILELPLTYRQIFQMKYVWGYTNKEIAEVLNIREGALRQRIARGKKLLQKLLEEREVCPGEETAGR